jgi:hypothetical protein
VGAWDISFLFPSPCWFCDCRSGEAKNLAGENALRLIQDRLGDAEFGKNAANLSNQFAARRVKRIDAADMM